MKKFTITVSVILAIVLVVRYLIVYENFYIDINPDAPIDVLYSTDEQYIYDNTGQYPKAITLQGVILDSSLPGHYTTDYAPTGNDYREWLKLIADMGANTVTVDSIMDSEFYEALSLHNETYDSPLYLIQSIMVEDYNANNADDFYYMYDDMLEDVHRVVDVIHGRDTFAIGRMDSGGVYNIDVSQWTLGYIVGSNWTPYTMAYTDNKIDLPTSYEGEFFSTAPEASRTEVFIADIMDALMSYETKRYKTQRLVTFNSSYSTDPLEYTRTVQIQLEKIVQMDIDHIIPSDKVQSGMFAGYIMRAGMEDFLSCLSDNDIIEYIDIISQVNPESIYGGYVHFLNLKHDIPVVVTSYGHSTARVVDSISYGDDRLTEQEQGQALVSNYYEFMGDGSQGAIIANWQDNWSRTTWNTRFAVDELREIYWFDTQTKDQCNGILSFDTNDGDICYVDGDISEWAGTTPVVDTSHFSLSARYDEGYLYLLAQGEDIVNTPIAIPIDVTPKTGSFTVTSDEYDLRLSHAADFVVLMDGLYNSRMIVQERYEAARANFEEEISDTNPYVYKPNPTENEFVDIRVVANKALDPNIDLSSYSSDLDALRREFLLLDVFLTGEMEHGNANPTAFSYNSLADYCFGQDAIEIRIPWQLLNFSDPSEMKIHDDYYPIYGVQEIGIDGINIGITSAHRDGRTQMEFLELKGWGNDVSYTPRLKESYEIIQNAWLSEEE